MVKNVRTVSPMPSSVDTRPHRRPYSSEMTPKDNWGRLAAIRPKAVLKTESTKSEITAPTEATTQRKATT